MNVRRVITIVVGSFVAASLVFACGVWVGVHIGGEQFALLDASAKAAVLTDELKVLRAGNGAQLIQSKEIEVDGAVVRAMEFQRSGMPWLFWPNAENWNHAAYLKRVAQYRKQYPPVVPGIAPKPGQQDWADLRGFGGEVERSTRELLVRYGG